MKTATLERVVALLAVGLSTALREKKTTLDEANHLLFSPHTMELLRRAGVREELVALIHRGTELEDIASLLPGSLDDELKSLEQDALKYLAGAPPYDFNSTKWLGELFASEVERGS